MEGKACYIIACVDQFEAAVFVVVGAFFSKDNALAFEPFSCFDNVTGGDADVAETTAERHLHHFKLFIDKNGAGSLAHFLAEKAGKKCGGGGAFFGVGLIYTQMGKLEIEFLGIHNLPLAIRQDQAAWEWSCSVRERR